MSLSFLVVTVSTHKQVFSTRVFSGPAFPLLLNADGVAGAHPNILPKCGHFISLQCFSPSARCTVSEGWGLVHSGIFPMSRLLLPGISARCGRRKHTGNADRAPPPPFLGEGNAVRSQKGLPAAVRHPLRTHQAYQPTTRNDFTFSGSFFSPPDCGVFLRTILRNEALEALRKEREAGGRTEAKGASPFLSPQRAYLLDCAIRSLFWLLCRFRFHSSAPTPTPVCGCWRPGSGTLGPHRKGTILGQGSDRRQPRSSRQNRDALVQLSLKHWWGLL